MFAKKEKNSKQKSRVKSVPKLSKAAMEPINWEKVQFNGNVISDEFGGYEGLIGLEVLTDYNSELVEQAQPQRTRKQKRMERNKLAKKRKLKASAEPSQDDDETDEETEEVEKKTKSSADTQSRKERLAERYAIKIQKQKEKRARRKNKVKGIGEVPTAANDEDNIDYPPDRFALLRPPPSESIDVSDDDDIDDDDNDDDEEKKKEDDAEDDAEDEAPELISSTTLELDDLEGWNGLGVPQPILRALAEKGFKSPTEIQLMTLPAAILGKKDILGAAETGSGKTLAFGIPLLAGIIELKAKNSRSGIRKAPKVKGQKPETNEEEEDKHELTPPPEELNGYPEVIHDDDALSEDDNNTHMLTKKDGPLYAVVLTPTRELAVQVTEHLVAAAKYTGIKIAAIFGGLAVAKQERLLRKCPEIVVCTPGRFWELYQQENPHLSKINEISFLVIDETDRMVEKGHFEELRSLLKVLNADEKKKQSRQNFVFSATLTMVHDLPDHMQKRNTGKRPKFVKQTSGMKVQSLIDELGISQPKIVDITRSQQTAQTLTECRLICPIDHKDFYLYYFVERHPGRTIVFCNSIDCVKRLATIFGLLNCTPLPLHANMIQKQRLKNLERFRDSVNGLLIATDVAARGLDIPNVEHVIHYQVPRTSENYVHRSGRTARANKNGITVMFMEPGEVKNYVKLYRTLGRTEDLPLFPVSERYLGAVKERVNLARELDKQELKLRRTQNELGWMKKHADDMEMIIEGFNDDNGSDQDEDPFIIERRRNRIQLESVRSQLKSLLSQPIFQRGFSFKYPTSTGALQIPHISTTAGNSAVDTMKAAIEDMKQAKKNRNKKRKTTT